MGVYPSYMKKSFLLLPFLSLAFLFPTSVEAATFTDTPENHIYYESVEFLAENKIVNGNGNGIFAPDRFVTLNEFSIMLKNAFVPERMSAGPIPICFSMDWIPMYIVVKDPNAPLTKGEIYNIVSRVEGINVYSSTNSGPVILESDYLRAMQEVGLATENEDVNDYMTRAQASFIIHQMITKDIQTARPDTMTDINIELETTHNLGAYQYALSTIPEKVLNEFKNRDWTLIIGQKDIFRLNKENDLFANAWTSYVDKKIYVKDIASLTHEFGHFVHSLINFDSRITYLYKIEGEQFNEKYNNVGYNVHEYFAEYFSKFIAYRNDEKKSNELKDIAPKTFEYFFNLDILN